MENEVPQNQQVSSESSQNEQKKTGGFFNELVVSYKKLTLYRGDRIDALLTPSQMPCVDVLGDVWFLTECPQCKKKHIMPVYLAYLEKFNLWVVKPLVRIGYELFIILRPILGPLFVAGRSMTSEMMEKKKEMERQATGVPKSARDIQIEKEKLLQQKNATPPLQQ